MPKDAIEPKEALRALPPLVKGISARGAVHRRRRGDRQAVRHDGRLHLLPARQESMRATRAASACLAKPYRTRALRSAWPRADLTLSASVIAAASPDLSVSSPSATSPDTICSQARRPLPSGWIVSTPASISRPRSARPEPAALRLRPDRERRCARTCCAPLQARLPSAHRTVQFRSWTA